MKTANESAKILVVDDDPDARGFLSVYLKKKKYLIEEAEGLIKNTAEDLPEKSKKELLERLERLKKSSHRIDEQTYAGVEVVDQVIRRYPYQSLGAAALGGILLSIILNKR